MNAERIAAVAFGVVFIGLLIFIAWRSPDPSGFQIFVYRAVLSVAAAGIGAFLPGFLTVNVPPYVKAGGAMALFAIVFFVNPPDLISPAPFFEAMRRGDGAVASQQYSFARQFYDQASRLAPKSWTPYYGLGRAEFYDRKYALSLRDFQTAYDLEGHEDGSTVYALATVADALQQPLLAKKYLLQASKILAPNDALWPEVIFDIGLTNLELWFADGAPRETKEYTDADLAFQQFLQSRGSSPAQWALYDQACLWATRADDESLPQVKRDLLRSKANKKLEDAVVQLAAFESQNASLQRHMMKTLLQSPDTWHRGPGEPLACSALVRSWKMANNSVNSLIDRLPGS